MNRANNRRLISKTFTSFIMIVFRLFQEILEKYEYSRYVFIVSGNDFSNR